MAVPKIFQSFNSLLGGITRKKNATIVGPSKQLVGEFPPITFERLYEYYHGWDQIKRAMDTIHQKFMGAGIEIKSNNEAFNTFIKKWWDVSNAEKKMGEFFYSVFITGNGILEKQYTSDNRLGNIEHIPMQTIYRVFRDQYGVELKLVQIVDGVFKELDPQFFVHWMINNPDRQAFGKSEFFSLASPRPVASKVDPMTGEAINPDRVLRPLLDSQAVLQNAEVEIKQKMSKPRVLVSAVGMPRDQMQKIQLEMSDESNDQYIWMFDKPIESKELSIQGTPKFDQYGENVENHIDIGTGFASKVIKNSSGFSYSSSQTPFDVLDQRMVDLQSQASEMIKDRIIKPIAESWGFKDFEEMEVEVSFMPSVRRLSMEDIQKLPSDAVSPEEKRELLKKLHIPLDDTLWDEFQSEAKKEKQDQAEQNFGQPELDQFGGIPIESPTSPTSPVDTGSPPISRPDNEDDRPEPTRTDSTESSVPTKDDYKKWFKEAVAESLSNERIPLPPSATNDSKDLYVSQGLDQDGTPEITDPVIRQEYGMDDDDSELPPNAPQRSAKVGDTPSIDDEFSGQKDERDKDEGLKGHTKDDDNDEDEDGNAITNVDNGDQINDSSDGTFKDPYDLDNTQEETPETENPQENPHPRPNEEPVVEDEEEKIGMDVEMEFTDDEEKAKDTVEDHLEEDPEHYSRLKNVLNDEKEVTDEEYEKEKSKEAKPLSITGGNDKDEDLPQNIGKSDGDIQLNDNDEDKQIVKDSQDIEMDTKQTPPADSKIGEDPQVPPNDPEQPDEEERVDLTTFTDVETPEEDEAIGDSSQARLRKIEDGEEPQSPPEAEGIFDNTGLNSNNDEVSTDVTDSQTVQQNTSDIGNQEEQTDGAIITPEEVRQTTPDNLHQDPETGRNYTEDTDEQGNKIPDLRFDQTEDSVEEQPDVEPEFNIVSQDDYEDEKMSFDQFEQELEKPNMEKENPFDLDNEQPKNFDFPVLQNSKEEEATEEITGPPADSNMVANNYPEEPDVLPDGKVVKDWNTKEGN